MSALLELIVVMTLIGLLVGIALPAYRDATQRAREATLKEDLTRMRTAIDEYLERIGRAHFFVVSGAVSASRCQFGHARMFSCKHDTLGVVFLVVLPNFAVFARRGRRMARRGPCR